MHRHDKIFPHNQSVEGLIDSFKHTKLSGSLTALYSNRIIQQFAGGLLGLFLPIFFYIAFDFSLYKLLLYYLISWSIWVLIIPIGAMIMSKIGMKKALIISVIFGTAQFYFLRLYDLHSLLYILIFVIFAATLDRLLYWVPYHTDFAKFTDRRTRGKQISFLVSIASLVSIFTPFIAGYVINAYGFDALFLFVIIIYIMSVIPLFLLPDIRENFSFGYFQSYKEVFSKKNRRLLLSYGADGMQSMVGIVIWPIFIWLLLDKNYETVGLVSSLIVLFSLLLRLIMGEFSDRYDKHRGLRWGTILNSFGWLFKMFVGTGFQIFIASTYHSFASIVMRTPFDALMYEKAADSGHYVDEYTVVREISLNFGKVVMIGLVAGVFFITGGSFVAAFLMAAIAALLINVI